MIKHLSPEEKGQIRRRMEKGVQRHYVLFYPDDALALLDEVDFLLNEIRLREARIADLEGQLDKDSG